MLSIILGSLEDYCAWRASTGGIIQGGGGIDGKTERALKNRMHSKITEFIPETTMSNKKDAEIIVRALDGIVDKAIELAAIFNQSRCVYRLEQVTWKEEFSSEWMEYGEECDALKVDLMISPALVKCGNSKGQNYDQYLVLAKSCVCCLKPYAHEKREETRNKNGKGSRDGDGEGNSLG